MHNASVFLRATVRGRVAGSTGAQQTTIPFFLYSQSIATAVSLRKCSDTLPGHPEATNRCYAGGLCELSAVASAILPYPTIQLLTASRSTEEQVFYQPSTLSLPLQLASSRVQGLSRPAPWLCLQVFLLGLVHTQALQPGRAQPL